MAGRGRLNPLAMRNNQARVKGFSICYHAGSAHNPTAQLSGIQVKVDEASRVRPLSPRNIKDLSRGQERIAAPQCGPRQSLYAVAALVRLVPCGRSLFVHGRARATRQDIPRKDPTAQDRRSH